MKTLSQVIVLLLITAVVFAASAYAQYFTRTVVFGAQVPRSYFDMVTCALGGALAATVVASAPLSAAFRKHAWATAVAVSVPVLALRINELFTYAGSFARQVQILAIVEALSYLGFLVLGAWCLSRVWPRPNNSLKPTPLRGLTQALDLCRRNIVAKVNCIDFLEFPGKNVESVAESKNFYSKVFGWKFKDWGDDYIDTQSSGLSSGFNADSDHCPSAPLAVIYSDDLKSSYSSVKSSGGKISREIFEFPGGKRFHFIDPSGNELAVWSDQ